MTLLLRRRLEQVLCTRCMMPASHHESQLNLWLCCDDLFHGRTADMLLSPINAAIASASLCFSMCAAARFQQAFVHLAPERVGGVVLCQGNKHHELAEGEDGVSNSCPSLQLSCMDAVANLGH